MQNPTEDDGQYSGEDKRPLPLIVAERWEFNLQFHILEGGYWYAAQDWISGLLMTNLNNASRTLTNFYRENETTFSKRSLDYKASDGKIYQRDFVTDNGLYVLAQHFRVTKVREQLREIRDYLAASGVFVDETRRDPKHVVESGAISPDEAIDAAIEAYKQMGKDDNWINARLMGKVKRHMFTAALKAAIGDIENWQYALATDQVYIGLWDRTAKALKEELGIAPKASLRDHQPTLALTYQAIAEEVSAKRLGGKDEVEWEEAKAVVREVADLIGKQAKATGRYLGQDLATGKPLLKQKQGGD